MTPNRDILTPAKEPATVADYLTLDELEAIAWEFRDQGVSIVAAAPDEWHLVVHDDGVQRKFRAHRPVVGGAA